MKEKLTQFLTQLTTDFNLVTAYKQNKLETMLEYGLSQEHCDWVINKNYDEISIFLGADFSIAHNDLIKAYRSSESILTKRFAEFLTQLTTDNELISDFKTDAVDTMKHFGLTQKCIDMVMKKDYEAIQEMLGNDYSITTNNVIRAFQVRAEQKKAS